MTLPVVKSAEELTPWHGGGFVPTMGALHDGHLALVRRAAELTSPVVVSVFVNPKQFDEAADLDRYPRQLERDVDLAEQAGADVVFAPPVEVVYPVNDPVAPPDLPGVATRPGLEDQYRPGHLDGVCQVVARLFDLVRPGVAVFGEKDYQQLLVVRAMVEASAGRWVDLRIEGHPTIREPDGLARSSRNQHLSVALRDRALGLVRALTRAHVAQTPAEAETLMAETLAKHDLEVQYAVVRDAVTLLPIDDYARPARALVAAKLDEVRLIDNMGIQAASS